MVIFLTMLGLVFCFSIIQSGDARRIPAEARISQERPHLPGDFDSLVSFLQEYEAWFNDNMFLRNELVTFNSQIMMNLLQASSIPDRVVIGKEGWMFLGNYWDNVIEKHQGTFPDSENALEETVLKLSLLKRILDKKGVPLIVSIAPSKHRVYEKYLPSGLANTGMTSFLDSFSSKAKKRNVDILDLASSFDPLSKETPLYFKYDSHWNAIGGYLGYREIMQEASRKGLNLKHLEWLKKTRIVAAGGGGLAQMLHLEKVLKEINVFPILDSPKAPLLLLEDGKKTNGNIYLRNAHESPAKVIVCDKPLNPQTVLFLHDSFGSAPLAFLCRSFSKVINVHSYSGDASYLIDLVDLYQPDIVIYLSVERLVNKFCRISLDQLAASLFADEEHLLLSTEGSAILERFRNQGLLFDKQSRKFSIVNDDPLVLLLLKKRIRNNQTLLSLEFETEVPMQLQLSYGPAKKGEEEIYNRIVKLRKGKRTYAAFLPQQNVRKIRICFRDKAGNPDQDITFRIIKLAVYRCKLQP